MWGETARASTSVGTNQVPFDLDVGLARREPEFVVRGGVPVERLLDRLAREVEPDPRAVDLGLAAGVVVDLEDHVGLARQAEADPLGEVAGLVPGVPEAELLEERDARPRERGVPRPLLGLVPLPRVAGRVEVGADVVHDPAVPRPEVDRRDVGVLRRGSWGSRSSDRRPAPEAGTAKSSAGSSTRSGVPSFQPSANLGGGGMSFGSPCGAPASAQASRMAISSVDSDWSCLSGGPTPGAGFQGGISRSAATVGDVRRTLPGLLVRLQGEGPDLVAAMAVQAPLLEDRGHVPGERRRPASPPSRLLAQRPRR